MNQITIPPYGFEDVIVTSDDGIVRVVLEWNGEGICDEYDSDDPEDVPLIRYDIYRRCTKDDDQHDVDTICGDGFYENDEWFPVEDGSYCTQIPATAPREQIVEAAKFILNYVEDSVRCFERKKRLYETLSWIGLVNGKPYCQLGCEEFQVRT
jgi:hypothetical protein